jgi:uridine kinase
LWGIGSGASRRNTVHASVYNFRDEKSKKPTSKVDPTSILMVEAIGTPKKV